MADQEPWKYKYKFLFNESLLDRCDIYYLFLSLKGNITLNQFHLLNLLTIGIISLCFFYIYLFSI